MQLNLLKLSTLALAAAGVFESSSFGQAILPQLATSPLVVANTVPANGDVNPYGVAFVPPGFAKGGVLHAGDILVANFNNSANLQGTGTTIVAARPDGSVTQFFGGQAGLGLTTALGVLSHGIVLVGNLPTTDGTFQTVQQGSLIAIDRWGNEIASFADSTFLDGPWDLALIDEGDRAVVFVSSVLNGTVSRLVFKVADNGEGIWLTEASVVAWGYLHRGDPNALVIGPTGLAYDSGHDKLYIASTGDNAIYSIDHALITKTRAKLGTLVYKDEKHLRGPLGLLLAPNGDLITSNGDAINGNPNQPSELVEFTPAGHFVAQYSVDLGGQGGAFGIAIHFEDGKYELAAVDDVANTLEIWTVNR